MSRVITMATIMFAIGAAFTLYQVKYEVRDLQKEARGLIAQVVQGRSQIRVLKAEWSYLNRPNRLEDLSERYLHMQPMTDAQLGTINQLPMRPDDAPQSSANVPDVVASNGVPTVAVPRADSKMPVPTLRPRPPAQSKDSYRTASAASPSGQTSSPGQVSAHGGRRTGAPLPSLTPLFVSIEGDH